MNIPRYLLLLVIVAYVLFPHTLVAQGLTGTLISFSDVNKKAGKVINTGTNVVSRDGKTMTFTSKGTNAQGQPTSGVQVFEKQ